MSIPNDTELHESLIYKILIFFIEMIIVISLFIGGIWFLGLLAEGTSRIAEQHAHCLKHATNGYEIKQCH